VADQSEERTHDDGVRSHTRPWFVLKVLMRVEAGLLGSCCSARPPPLSLSLSLLMLLSCHLLPLGLLVSLSLALVCFGSSSATHVARVCGLPSVRDACDTHVRRRRTTCARG